jgi:hypothetical protein
VAAAPVVLGVKRDEGLNNEKGRSKEVTEFHKVVYDWMAIPLISKLPAQYG